MSKISMTVKHIIELGLWEKVCTYKRWGKLDKVSMDTIVEFDTEFEKGKKSFYVTHPKNEEYMLFAYIVLAKPDWRGSYCGLVWAKDKKQAVTQVEQKFKDRLHLEIDDNSICPVDLKDFDESECRELWNDIE